VCIPDLVIIKYFRNNTVQIKRIVSIVLFPKYFIITKSGIHTVVLTDFVYCIFP